MQANQAGHGAYMADRGRRRGMRFESVESKAPLIQEFQIFASLMFTVNSQKYLRIAQRFQHNSPSRNITK
jgi:hypothetical protein